MRKAFVSSYRKFLASRTDSEVVRISQVCTIMVLLLLSKHYKTIISLWHLLLAGWAQVPLDNKQHKRSDNGFMVATLYFMNANSQRNC